MGHGTGDPFVSVRKSPVSQAQRSIVEKNVVFLLRDFQHTSKFFFDYKGPFVFDPRIIQHFFESTAKQFGSGRSSQTQTVDIGGVFKNATTNE